MRILLRRWLVVVLAVMWSSSSVWALTYQDKQDKSIDEAGIMHVVETGTVLHQSASDTSLVGAETLTCGTVPTDKKWHVTSVSYNYTGTVTNVRVSVLVDGVTIDQDAAPTSNEAQKFALDVWLDEAETVKLTPIGATTGDDLYCWVHGIEYDATTAN